MNSAKIRLSPPEMELLSNAGWILTKNAIMQKGRLLLEGLATMQEEISRVQFAGFPPEVWPGNSKISRGENYKGLPYLVLDHPRYFDKENVFAIRTMLWWGNFFSTTLHLSGRYKLKHAPAIMHAFKKIAAEEFFLGVNVSEWEHHFEKDNYRLVRELSAAEWKNEVKQKPFLKLALKINLSEWDNAQSLLAEHYLKIASLINGQLPSR